jgi:hypothetical protein
LGNLEPLNFFIELQLMFGVSHRGDYVTTFFDKQQGKASCRVTRL